MRTGPTVFNRLSVGLGLAFLYAPIALLVLYSFNASRLVTVWAGFSTRWYAALAQDDQMLDAVWVTLRVGLISASVATVLGTLAAVALVRAGRFRGRALFSGMIYAPLVMPEVILGLSLLLLFVAVQAPQNQTHHHQKHDNRDKWRQQVGVGAPRPRLSAICAIGR